MPGNRAEDKRGHAVLVRQVNGGFMEGPGNDGRVIACVKAYGNGATKTGYHARNTDTVTIFDDAWFNMLTS